MKSKNSKYLDVIQEGIVPGKKNVITDALQKIIDSVGESGGGTVFFPPGQYLTGTLHLRSNIRLEFSPGARLVGSGNLDDYPPIENLKNPDNHKDLQPYHLLIADKCENLTLCGGGIIDGSGPDFWDPPSNCEFFTSKEKRPSPMLEFRQCKNLRLENLLITNSPGWTVHILECEKVWIREIDIENNLFGPNTDGLDITDSRDIIVSDSRLVCGDDAIVLKSLGGVNERITVTNCILQTRCSALKLGANESYGTIRQVAMSNCVIYESSRGISLYSLSGGLFEDISFSNIIMDCHNDLKLVCPIHINCSRNPSPNRLQKVGRIKNIKISDVLVKSDARILLTSEDKTMLENIHLHNIHMEYPVVEDEFELAANSVSGQFSPFNPEARGARAVVAACNINGLVLQNITVDWPKNPKVAMHVVWAKNLQKSLIDCPLATPSLPEVQKYEMQESDVIIRS